MTEGHAIAPFGLQAPSRLLVPYPHKRRNLRTRFVKLGRDGATLEVITWDKCLPGCTAPVTSHEAGRTVRLKVPCDSLPHCHACECGDGHDILVAEDQVADMLAVLS